MLRLRHVLCWTVGLVVVVVFPQSASAQRQRVFVRVGATVAEIHTAHDRLGDVIRTWPLPPDVSYYGAQGRVVGQGRYVLFGTIDGTVVLDVATGTVLRPDFPTVLGTTAGDAELVGFRPYSASGDGRIEVLTLTTLERRTIPLPQGCLADVAFAAEARAVALLRSERCVFGSSPTQWIDLISIDGLSTRQRVVEFPSGSGQTIAINAAATRLWVMTPYAGFPMPRGYTLHDLTNGRLIAQNHAVEPALPPFTRFLHGPDVLLSVTSRGLAAFDPETLQVLATADAARPRLDGVRLPVGYSGYFGHAVLADAEAEAVFVYEYSGMSYSYHGGPCLQSALIALDPASGARVASRDLRLPNGQPVCFAAAAMAIAPPAPRDLRATVTNGRVTLHWNGSPEAFGYELEAGSAPGLRNLARISTGATTLVSDQVPRGRYYVRVRAVNYAGKGAYTADLVVTVE